MHLEYQRAYRLKHKEEKKERNKKYYQNNKEKHKEYNREYNEQHRKEIAKYAFIHKDKIKNRHLKRRFKLSLDEYMILWNKQNGKCAICRKEETVLDHRSGKTRMLAVDHNHDTGNNRGLLCNNCNQGLGRFQDSLTLLEAAVAYLKSS